MFNEQTQCTENNNQCKATPISSEWYIPILDYCWCYKLIVLLYINKVQRETSIYRRGKKNKQNNECNNKNYIKTSLQAFGWR